MKNLKTPLFFQKVSTNVTIHGQDMSFVGQIEDCDKAADIVLAVNCHDEAVRLLERAKQALRQWEEAGSEDYFNFTDIIEEAEAFLAKARA